MYTGSMRTLPAWNVRRTQDEALIRVILLVSCTAALLGCGPDRPAPADRSARSSTAGVASAVESSAKSADAAGVAHSPPVIVQTGALVLRSRAAEVTPAQIGTDDFQKLVRRMIDTMRKAPGVGLAAPQIGVGLRVIVLEDREALLTKLTPAERAEREREPFETRVIVNPVLTLLGDETATFFEGCLSVSGYAALVPRRREVHVTGLDEHGKPVDWHVKGWPARILQHEVDHLEGTLYIDRMHSRSYATNENVKSLYAGEPILEVKQTLGIP